MTRTALTVTLTAAFLLHATGSAIGAAGATPAEKADRRVARPVAAPQGRAPAADASPEWRPARKLAGGTGTSVGFSRDGRRLLTAGGDEARVWDPATGKQVGAPIRTGRPIRHAALSPDGARVLTAGANDVRVWDVAGGRQLAAVAHARTVRSAALSPDGAMFVTAAKGESEVIVRDAATGEVAHRLPHPGPAHFAAFSPDGSAVLTLAASPERGEPAPHVAVLWDARTAREIRRRRVEDVNSDGDHWSASAAFSPDGRLVATPSFRRVDVWEAATGKQLVSMDTIDAGMGTFAMVFSPDGTRLLTLDGVVANLWDTRRQHLVVKLKATLTSAAFSPDGRLVVSGGQFAGAGLWDLRTGRPLLEFRGREFTAIPAVAFAPDGNRFAVGYGEEGETTVWERQPPPEK